MAPGALSHADCCPGRESVLFIGAQFSNLYTAVVLVRRTASPEHADFGGLSLGAAPVVVRLDVVPLPPRSSTPTVVERALREECPGTMTGVFQYWFSGHFRQVFSTPMHYPALTLAPKCGAEHHDKCLLTLVLVYFEHRMGSV